MTQRTPAPGTAALNIPVITRRDVRIANWICFFAWTFAVYDFVLFGNLLPKIADHFSWSASGSTAVNTWVTGGTAIVAFAIGPFVDRAGRKQGIVISVIGAAVFSLLTAAVGLLAGVAGGLGVVLLIIVRSLAGLGYGEQAVNATYLNELYGHSEEGAGQAHNRGFIYSLVQSGWPVGSVIAAVSIRILEPVGGWELCFIVSVFPAIFMIVARRYLKESPVFVARREAQKLVRAGNTAEAKSLAGLMHIDLQDTKTPVMAVFTGESKRPILIIGIAFLLSWMGVLTFDILGTSFLTSATGKNISFSNSVAILAISNGTAFAGYLLFGWLGDRMGRRNAISIGWLLCGVSTLLLVLVPNSQLALIIILYSATLFFLIGPYAALLFFNAESFPAHTRATGGALINGGGQLGALIASLLVTATLAAHWTWSASAFYWGVLPIFASGILILFARNVDPHTLRHD